ncbi:MAG: hypothetical protein JWO87_670, partial [Phycisphaerales bacterium]|nr:hypothetical protein [Phycisphaerales bacterium]
SSGDSNPPTPLSHAAVLAARDPQWAHAYRDDDFLPPIEVEIEEELLPAEDAPPEFKELRRQQQLALEQLLEGKSVAWAAASAQVDRRTVHRWVRDDERFKAAMEACRGRTVEAVRRQLLAAAPKAAAAIAEAADKGDIKAAMALLKALGLFGSPPAAESSDPPGPPKPTRGRTPRVLSEPAAQTGTQSAAAPEPSNAPAPPVVEEKFDWRKVKRVRRRSGGYRLVYKGAAYMEAMRIADENAIRMGEKAG